MTTRQADRPRSVIMESVWDSVPTRDRDVFLNIVDEAYKFPVMSLSALRESNVTMFGSLFWNKCMDAARTAQ